MDATEGLFALASVFFLYQATGNNEGDMNAIFIVDVLLAQQPMIAHCQTTIARHHDEGTIVQVVCFQGGNHTPYLSIQVRDDGVVISEMLPGYCTCAWPRSQLLVAQHDMPIIERVLRHVGGR